MKDIILIPTYNEKGNIEEIIARTLAACPLAEVRVIDDSSPDGTAEIVNSVAAKNPQVKLYSRSAKNGLGEAYKDILSKIQKESGIRYVITMDADGSHDPAAIPQLMAALDSGYDLVIGSRYVKAGKIEGWSVVRFILSWCGNMYTRIITGSPIHDGTAGFVAFKAEAIRTLDFATISGHGYAYQIEFKNAVVKRGGKWKEIPITFTERKIGVSKISGKIIWEGLWMPWKIRNKKSNVKNLPASKKYFIAFILCIAVCACVSLLYFDHIVGEGDEVSYIDAMNILAGAPLPATESGANFAMHRILTTFLGLEVILVLSWIFGNIITAWLLWETVLYFVVSITFYKLLEKMFKSQKTAFIGGLFFVTNYAMITAGLGLFMDIGGWTFYIMSAYFLFSYIESPQKRTVWLAALAIAVGAFFKENALVAYVPLFFVLAYEHYFEARHKNVTHTFVNATFYFLKQIIPLSFVIFVPIAIHHVDVYIVFNHGYLYWVTLNQQVYHYGSRTLEYIKSFGSLLTFLAPLSLAGFIVLIKSAWSKAGRTNLFTEFGLDAKRAVFIISVLVSSLPGVMWPGITQRVLFIVVPGLIMLACFFIRRYEKYWYGFLGLLIIYTVTSFLMGPVLLEAVNLPF